MRLAKFLAHAGVASRRGAEEIVRAGRVTVAGETVTDPARDVDDSSGVAVDGEPLKGAEDRVVYLLHKPRGVVSTAKDTHDRKTVLDLVDARDRRLYPVGRLDTDTTGLILITNDGDLAHRLTHPSYEVPRTYKAAVRPRPVSEKALRQLRDGVRLEDGLTSPAQVRQIEPGVIELTLHEGRNRQVRRMVEAVGHKVSALERTRFGPLRIGTLREGAVRRLTGAEIEQLRKAASDPQRRPRH